MQSHAMAPFLVSLTVRLPDHRRRAEGPTGTSHARAHGRSASTVVLSTEGLSRHRSWQRTTRIDASNASRRVVFDFSFLPSLFGLLLMTLPTTRLIASFLDMPITPLAQQPMQIEIDVDFDAHLDHAWDVAQALWEAEEEERRRRAGVADDCLYGALSDCSTSPPGSPHPLSQTLPPSHVPQSSTPPASISPSSPPLYSSPFGSDLSSCESEHSSRATSPSTEYSSDANSEPEPGTSKRKKRREGWSKEKLENEKQRLKKKDKRLRAEGKRRRKRSAAQLAKKKERRRAATEEAGGPSTSDYQLPKNALDRWGSPEPVKTEYRMEGASAAAGAYVGINRPVDTESGADHYTLEGEIAKGRKYVPWDGMCVFSFFFSLSISLLKFCVT